ncbi:nuclear pore anchor [Trifolium repens]|nr:nuclear pore anchor [Trifolium repens]
MVHDLITIWIIDKRHLSIYVVFEWSSFKFVCNVVNVANTSLRTSKNSEAEGVISEHLLTFKDINGLVEQNIRLRSLVCSLPGQLENQEVEFKVFV